MCTCFQKQKSNHATCASIITNGALNLPGISMPKPFRFGGLKGVFFWDVGDIFAACGSDEKKQFVASDADKSPGASITTDCWWSGSLCFSLPVMACRLRDWFAWNKAIALPSVTTVLHSHIMLASTMSPAAALVGPLCIIQFATSSPATLRCIAGSRCFDLYRLLRPPLQQSQLPMHGLEMSTATHCTQCVGPSQTG